MPTAIVSVRHGRPRIKDTAYTGPLISRAEALAAGLKRFFTGQPCWHGHIAQRQASNKECIACAIGRSRARTYTDEDLARRAAKRRTDESRAAERAYKKTRVEITRASNSAFGKRWRDSEAGKAWNAEYAATKRAIVRNRRARQRASEGQHTAADIEALLRLQRGRCAYCRKKLSKNYHVDHIVPLAQGGSNDRRNLQIACAFCNVSKGKRDPIQHAKRIGLLI